MIPKIYKSSEREFKNNGFGFLTDVIKSSAYEERNGEDKITIDYPIEGKNYDKLVRENIIMYKASATRGKQPYRITSVKKKQDSASVEVIARHVTFDDLDNFVVKAETDLSPSVFMPNLPEMMILKTGVTYSSDNQTRPTVKLVWERKNPLTMIAGEEGSLLQIFGGDLKRDFWNVSFNKKRGRQGKVTVRNKRDLVGLDLTEDDTQVVTRIYPYKIVQVDVPVIGGEEGQTEKQDFLITLKEKFIDSQHIGDYRQPKIFPVDFSGDEKVTDEASLRERASKYFVENTGIDLPKVSGEIKVQELTKTTEYRNFSKLVSLDVCDKINVVSSKIGVRLSAVVNSIEYDGVAEDYIALNVGDKLLSFGEANKKQWNSVQNEITNINNSISDIEAGASFGNNATWGINPPANPKKGDLWFKQLEDGSAELYQWDGYGWELRIDPNIDEQIKEQIKDLETGMEEAKDIANNASGKALDNAKNFGNLLQNITREKSFDRWIAQPTATVKPYVSLTDQLFQGYSVKALSFNGTKAPTSQNAYIYSDWVKIDSSKAYEFSIWMKTPSVTGAVGQDYLRVITSDSEKKPDIADFRSSYHQTIVSATGRVENNVVATDFVVDSWSNHADWKSYRAVIMPTGFDSSDMKNRGYNVDQNARMKPLNTWLRIVVIAYGNAGTKRDTHWVNPILSEISSDATQFGSTVKKALDGIQVTVEGKADKSQVTQLADQITSVVEGQEKSPSNFNRYHDVWNKSKMYFSKTGTEPITTNIATNYLEKDSFILKDTTINTWTTSKMVATISPKRVASGLLSFPQPNSLKANEIKLRQHKTVATMKVKYLGDSPSGGGTRNSVDVEFYFGGVNIIGRELKKNEWVTISLAGDGTKATYGGATGITILYNPTFPSSFEFKDIGYFSDETTIPTPFPPFIVPSLTNQVVDQNRTYSSTDSKIKPYKWNSSEKIVSVEQNTTFLDSMIIGMPDDRLLHGGSMVTFTAKVRYKGTEGNPATPESPLVKQSLILKPMPFGRLVEGNEIGTTNYNESHLIDNKNWTTITKTVILNVDSYVGGIEINYSRKGNIPEGEVWDTTNKHFYEFSEIGFYEGGVRPAVVKDDYTPDSDAPLNNIEYNVDATSIQTFGIARFPKGSKQGSIAFPVYDNPYLEEGKEYIMTFVLSKTGGPNTISKGAYVSPNNYGGVAKDVLFELTDANPSITINQKFIFKKEPTTDRFNRIRFWTGRSDALPLEQTFKISKVGIYEGSVPSVILDNYPSDVATRSSITQLADNINLKVDKDGVISQINLSSEGVLIQGKNIWLDGNTKIDKAVIKSANIESVSASQISAGTIDAKEINVINLSANAIRTGSIVGKNLKINLDSGVVTFQHGRIEKTDGNFLIDVDAGTFMTRQPGVRRTLLESGMITLWDTTLSGGLFNETRLGRIANQVTDVSFQSMFSFIGSTGALLATEGSVDTFGSGIKGSKMWVTGKTGKITVAHSASNWSPSSGAKPILAYIKGLSFDIRGVQPINYSNSKLEYKIFVDSDVGYQWILEQDIAGGTPTYNYSALGAYMSGERQVKIEAGSNPSRPSSPAQTLMMNSEGTYLYGNIREMFTSLTPSLNQSGTLKFAEDHIKAYYGAHIRMVTGWDGQVTFAQNVWNGSWAIVKGNLQNQSHRFQKTNIIDMEDGAIEKLDKLRFREYNRVSQLKSGRLAKEWGLVTDEIPFNELVSKDREGIVLYPLVSLVGKGLQEEVAKRKTLEERVEQLEKIIENLVK